MARKSHRHPSNRDVWRPPNEEPERGHERRGRSKSRERHRSPLPPIRASEKSWRSPDALRDYDRPSASSRRERDHSTESKRSARYASPSPHRSSRNERDSFRSSDISSRHSHKRHRVSSPPPKRRRSRSPPYPAHGKSSKSLRRPRSPPPRATSPHKRERPARDISPSPRRAASPRNSRKYDARPATHNSDRSTSPGLHTRRRSLSPKSPSRNAPVSRHSPPPTDRRTSPKSSSRRFSPPHPPSASGATSKRLSETRRRSPPPRKRRNSPKEPSPGSPSKRRRLTQSPNPPRKPSSPTSTNPTTKDQNSDHGKLPNNSRNSEKELFPEIIKTKEAAKPTQKSSPPTSPRGSSRSSRSHKSTESKPGNNQKHNSPLRPIPTFDSQSVETDGQPRPDPSDGAFAPPTEPSSTVPQEFEETGGFKTVPPTGPYVNPERAARNLPGYGRGRNWNQNAQYHGQGNPNYQYRQSSFTGANSASQGPPSGPAHFNQPHTPYGPHHSSYQQSYRGQGFRQNGFAPVVEHDRRFGRGGAHSFQIQTPPRQPSGRGINIYMGAGRGVGRGGRFEQQRPHMASQQPAPSEATPEEAPPQESEEENPDDNPYRPASFRIQDELEEEEEQEEPKVQPEVPPPPPPPLPPQEPKELEVTPVRPANDATQMPPPTRPAAQTPQKRKFGGQQSSENIGQSFRPFSINLSRSRTNVRAVDVAPRTRNLATENKVANATSTSSAAANTTPSSGSASIKVVDVLKAAAQKEAAQMANSPQRYVDNPNDPYRFSVYERVSMVGEGTYGKVYKAKNKNTRELVALKRIRMESERDGFPITAVREMKLLQSLKHENIVSLLETMVERSPHKGHSDFYMVFEYMSHDLTGILHHPTFTLEPGHIKHLAQQFFQGLEYLHHRGVLHRDIKASNILLDSDGVLKLADFGLARFYQKRKRGLDYTNRIITLWYRPPEILLGDTAYGPAVDIWSAGCVFVELFTRQAIFPGQGEIDQLDVIYELLGTPTKAEWPGLTRMPWYELLKPPGKKESRFDEKYKDVLPPVALELVKSIFSFDPDKRPTAAEVLQHAYFTDELPPAKPCSLKHLTGDWHEFEAKGLRKKREKAAKEKEASRRSMSSGNGGGGGSTTRERPEGRGGSTGGSGGNGGSGGGGGSRGGGKPPHKEAAHTSATIITDVEMR